MCHKCRKREYNDRAKVKHKISDYVAETEAERKQRLVRALESEYLKATRDNRVRLAVLQANTKPTKATTRNLTRRLELQAQWSMGLQELKKRIENNEPVGSLRDYMEQFSV